MKAWRVLTDYPKRKAFLAAWLAVATWLGGGVAGGALWAQSSSGPQAAAARPSVPAAPSATVAPALLLARRALARGDLVEALRQVQAAKGQPLPAGGPQDSPQAVEQLIRQQQRFAAGPAVGEDPAVFHRAYAEFLLSQADQLILYNDLDTAEYLAQQAKNLPVEFRPFERSPDAVLQTVAARRRAGSDELRRLPALETGQDDQAKQRARQLLAQAQLEMDRGNLAVAHQLAEQARNLNVTWEPSELQPWQLLLEIGNRQRQRGMPVMPASAATDPSRGESRYAVQPGVYVPEQDASRVVPAGVQQPTPAQPAPQNSQGMRLYQQGLQALEKQEIGTALELFRQAWRYEAELDPQTRQQLRDKLTLLQAVAPPSGDQPKSPLEEVAARQQIAQQQLFREINNEQRAAEQQLATDPKGALNRMQTLRNRVANADIDPAVKKQFLTFVDRQIQQIQAYIDQNRVAIEQDERNRKIEADRLRDQQELLMTQDKLAELVEQFNTLMDQQRYSEAEVIARQARQIAPDEPVVATMLWKSRFAHRVMADAMNRDAKENGFVMALQSVDESAAPFDDRNPIVFGDPKRWDELTRRRLRMMERSNRRLSPDEQEIQKALSTRISVNLKDVPLSEALKTLCDIANIPVFLDPQGLAVEGIATDQPVTLELPKEIPLRSALNLILQPLRLNYVIEDDVLKITSQGARNAKVYAETYNVADLVIPIPNFVPGHSLGLPEAIREAHLHLGQLSGAGNPIPLTLSPDALTSAPSSGSVLAQTQAFGRLPSKGSRARPHRYAGDFRGVMGGVTEDDFQPLIDLITTTIAPDSWDINGGNGAIQPFVANLSLVVSQTQDVHEQIADLLDQLRRLQDLQVTIEVRFITLRDNFFERIGIDFDFNIDDNSGLSTRTPLIPDDTGPSIAIGLNPVGDPTPDLDFQFRQESFNSAVPQFGGFDAATAANFGFAILSDIEVFFLLQAAQGDRRSNVLQAPKVTMFNGQIATINDTANKPFVTQIIPVVGDFAAAHMPVITVLSEGTSLSVQAVVSQDRRFVRLTLVPVFSEVGEVSTFTFTGRTSTNSGTNVLDPAGNLTGTRDNEQVVTEAATVQLPTFLTTSVSTTVNVPDGGTILLGGIKRLAEGRNENAVPMLGKIPYINRLFKNIGIGREAQSLMMMVTPRIIIQEEEEAKLGQVAP
ncbi:MAG: general secretion pathway protein GspD [Pirellulaceae bacterium]|nr:MAG: general secretion pathway protein GspD [Pirellulaceae bacterium]